MINSITEKTINNFDDADDIPNELKLTIEGNLFLQHDSGVMDKERVIEFLNSEKIFHLKNSSTWLSDGTFKMEPYGFYRIYILYAKIFDEYFLLVYSFLTNKTEKTYSRLFSIISVLIENNAPKYITMDFEFAPMEAFKNFFPNTKIYNRFFHFTQII
ncbi:hypothetical protein DMUE_3370 [Dictyocoela muelleri]|nr:hypothetical protein DMUE_3370 [Dictyocoela muelleri]